MYYPCYIHVLYMYYTRHIHVTYMYFCAPYLFVYCGVNNLCTLYLDIVPFVKDARLSEQSCFKSTIFVQKISYWICILGGRGKMGR